MAKQRELNPESSAEGATDDATPFRRMLVAIDESPRGAGRSGPGGRMGRRARCRCARRPGDRGAQAARKRRGAGQRPGGAAGTTPRGERADVGRPQPSAGRRHSGGGGGLRRRRHRPRLRPTAPGRSPACAQPARADHARRPSCRSWWRPVRTPTADGSNKRGTSAETRSASTRSGAMPVFDTVVVGAADSEGADAGLPSRPRADAGHGRHAAHRRCHRPQKGIRVGAVDARGVPLHRRPGPARPIGSCPSSSRRPPARGSTSPRTRYWTTRPGRSPGWPPTSRRTWSWSGRAPTTARDPSPTCRRPSWTTWAVPSWSCRERTRTAR